MISLSVLLPVYRKDNPDHLRLAFESVFAQTVLPQEIVVTVDGPIGEDLERELGAAAELSPVRFEVVRIPENVGLGRCLNHGMKFCHYEYIARMDADDIAVNDRFAVQLKALEADKQLSVIGGAQHEFRFQVGDCKKVKGVPCTHAEITRWMKFRNPMNHPTVVFRKADIEGVGGYQDFYLLEDYYLWYRLVRAGYKLGNVPETVLYGRIGNGMVVRRSGIRYFRSEYRLHRMMREARFASFFEFAFSVSVKFCARLMPSRLLQALYWCLRSKPRGSLR
jgi:glycosyltransferase involved in cell wall biosynthesis